MEKQMRAERDRRAAILTAEGVKQSQILTAEGDKAGAVLRADGDRQARILQAEGQAKAIRTVFDAIHTANPDPKVLAYQYLQALPQIAAGASNKIWIVPIELTRALEGIGGALGGLTGKSEGSLAAPDEQSEIAAAASAEADEAARAAAAAAEEIRAEVQAAAAEASGQPAARPGGGAPLGLPAPEPTLASALLDDEPTEQIPSRLADRG
jgi:hypothetical protein